MIDQETPQISTKESIQNTLVRIIQIKPFKTIPITDDVTHLVTRDPLVTLDLTIIAIKIDQEIFLIQHFEKLTNQNTTYLQTK